MRGVNKVILVLQGNLLKTLKLAISEHFGNETDFVTKTHLIGHVGKDPEGM